MIMDAIKQVLWQLQDAKYRDFQAKLIPTVDPETIIGVRTPELRKLAKQMSRQEDIGDFLSSLPHTFFEENQLHAFILAEMKDYAECLAAVNLFLPWVDNWATCDQLSPKVFKKHKVELLVPIQQWINSGKTYTIRFGIGMLMAHYLEDAFDLVYPQWVAAVRSEEYYVRMMVAWYFATALSKQYEAVIPYIEEQSLDPWTHNKAIQKAIESYRITDEQKAYLRKLKV